MNLKVSVYKQLNLIKKMVYFEDTPKEETPETPEETTEGGGEGAGEESAEAPKEGGEETPSQ